MFLFWFGYSACSLCCVGVVCVMCVVCECVVSLLVGHAVFVLCVLVV